MKNFLLPGLILLGTLFSGCAAYVGTPLIGGLMTNVSAPVGYDTGPVYLSHRVLGEVEGRSKATSVLGLFATGDASIAKAYQNALQQAPGADALIDINIDYVGKSVLGLYASFTNVVIGRLDDYYVFLIYAHEKYLKAWKANVLKTDDI